MERVICLLIGYVFGLFQTAYFYGKAKGIDIRKYGSGNAGTTNALRVLGTKAGLIVLAGDCLKLLLVVIVFMLKVYYCRVHHQSLIQYRTSGEYLSAVPVHRCRSCHRT